MSAETFAVPAVSAIIERGEGAAQAVRAQVGGVEVLGVSPFCVTQNLCGIYSLVMQTFVCRAEGGPLARTGETEDIRWTPLETVAARLEAHPEDFFPMNVTPLRKYLSERGSLS